MARLIVGHTNHDLCRLWVRGDARYCVAFLSITGPGNPADPVPVVLETRHGYTGVIEVQGLQADSDYQVQVEFGRTATALPEERAEFGHCSGSFRTFPVDDGNLPNPFSFLLGSCNLHSLDDISSDTAFATISRVAEIGSSRFMMHCGDQIYYDIPNPLKRADLDEYREKYLDAWGDSRATRRFFTQLPQYMVLDDHELENNFANDMKVNWLESSAEIIKEYGIKVYREFQHIHNPQSFDNQSLYYQFDYGAVHFFVLDTRTERYQHRPTGSNQIINATQMRRFRAWLKAHKDDVKFVVSSVPFVGEVRDPGKDKWCSDVFTHQRESLLEYILREKITGLTFLTGDMHNSYHATMEVAEDDGTHNVVVHELMSSPINQLSKSTVDDYVTGARKPVSTSGFNYLFKLKKSDFYGEHSNVMLVGVDQRTITYDVYRTKQFGSPVLSGSYTV